MDKDTADLNLKIWKYVRGDISNSDFEKIIYYDDIFINYFGKELYTEVISNDYSNWDSTNKIKEKLQVFLYKYYPQKCKCIEVKDLAVVDMGEESIVVLKTIEEVVKRGEPYWWLHLSKCKNCDQYWLIAQEERQNDIVCMSRLETKIAEKIIKDNIWPSIFDKYEALLKIGKENDKSVRFFDPINGSSLAYTIEDLAKENPGIKLSYLAELLNIDIQTALIISKEVIKNKGVNINLMEELKYNDKKNRIIAYLLVGLLLLIITIVGFGLQSILYDFEHPGRAPLPLRDSFIPETAFCIGSWDGGSWYDIKKTDKEDAFHITTWMYSTGSPAFLNTEGNYILKKAIIKNGKEIYESNKWKNINFELLGLSSRNVDGWFTVGERYFDTGSNTYEARYNYVLIPEGWIYGYFVGEKTHGKKNFYENGKLKIDGKEF